jgi:hypothetical protein
MSRQTGESLWDMFRQRSVLPAGGSRISGRVEAGEDYNSLTWRIPSMNLPTVVDLQEYELETMFVAMSGFEQHALHSSMPPRRLLRRIQDDMMA